MAELAEHLQKKLKSGDKPTFDLLKAKSGSFAEVTDKTLLDEAERLRECIQGRIDEYYRSYAPKYYTRTNKLKESLRAETKVQYDGGRKYIGLYFNDAKSWGRSVVTGEWNGYKPWLMNDGWKDRGRSNPHFLGYAGYHYIEKGMKYWRDTLKSKNIEVRRIGSVGKFNIAKIMGYTFE